MTYKEEDFDEDNDTEEEDEEEEEVDIEATHQRLLEAKSPAAGSHSRLAELINPKKGFKFFIEQE